jgi:hypothetical protein
MRTPATENRHSTLNIGARPLLSSGVRRASRREHWSRFRRYDQLRSCRIIGVERTRLPVAK